MTEMAKRKTIVVVGASSKGGVGWAAAQRFARSGARVLVSARRRDALVDLATQIDGHAIACDIVDEAQVEALAGEVRQRVGQIDAVFNAVGRVAPGTLQTAGLAQLQEAMDTEYYGLFFLLKHLGPLIRDGGAFATVSSIGSTHYVPGMLPYSCAKAAANLLVKYAAVELAPRRIRVNAILPSGIDTPMMDGVRDNAAVMAMITKEVPLGRIAAADEIAAAAAWLCDDDCFMTGCLMPVDGGNHLRRPPFPDEMPSTVFDKQG